MFVALVKVCFNLKTAVGQARVCCPGVGWQGARQQQARACKDEQRSQAGPGQCNRGCSVGTQKVTLLGREKLNVHKVL